MHTPDKYNNILKATSQTEGILDGNAVKMLFYAVIFAIEPVRLYLGHNGNLNQLVSQLAGFFMFGSLIEVPLIVFCMGEKAMPMEYALDLVTLLLVVPQSLVALATIRHINRTDAVKHREAVFQLENAGQGFVPSTRRFSIQGSPKRGGKDRTEKMMAESRF